MKVARTKSKPVAKQERFVNFNTKVSSIEKRLDVKLNVDGNMKFGEYLKITGYPSLAEMLLI